MLICIRSSLLCESGPGSCLSMNFNFFSPCLPSGHVLYHTIFRGLRRLFLWLFLQKIPLYRVPVRSIAIARSRSGFMSYSVWIRIRNTGSASSLLFTFCIAPVCFRLVDGKFLTVLRADEENGDDEEEGNETIISNPRQCYGSRSACFWPSRIRIH